MHNITLRKGPCQTTYLSASGDKLPKPFAVDSVDNTAMVRANNGLVTAPARQQQQCQNNARPVPGTPAVPAANTPL